MRTILEVIKLRDRYIPFCGPFSGRPDIIADARVSIWFQLQSWTTTTEFDQTGPNCRGPCNCVGSRIRGNVRVLRERINRLKHFISHAVPIILC
jgi:hypothetical protein